VQILDESKLNEATEIIVDEIKYSAIDDRNMFTSIRKAIDIIIEQAQEPLLERIKELEKS
jgi:hypothetical protein